MAPSPSTLKLPVFADQVARLLNHASCSKVLASRADLRTKLMEELKLAATFIKEEKAPFEEKAPREDGNSSRYLRPLVVLNDIENTLSSSIEDLSDRVYDLAWILRLLLSKHRVTFTHCPLLLNRPHVGWVWVYLVKLNALCHERLQKVPLPVADGVHVPDPVAIHKKLDMEMCETAEFLLAFLGSSTANKTNIGNFLLQEEGVEVLDKMLGSALPDIYQVHSFRLLNKIADTSEVQYLDEFMGNDVIYSIVWHAKLALSRTKDEPVIVRTEALWLNLRHSMEALRLIVKLSHLSKILRERFKKYGMLSAAIDLLSRVVNWRLRLKWDAVQIELLGLILAFLSRYCEDSSVGVKALVEMKVLSHVCSLMGDEHPYLQKKSVSLFKEVSKLADVDSKFGGAIVRDSKNTFKQAFEDLCGIINSRGKLEEEVIEAAIYCLGSWSRKLSKEQNEKAMRTLNNILDYYVKEKDVERAGRCIESLIKYLWARNHNAVKNASFLLNLSIVQTVKRCLSLPNGKYHAMGCLVYLKQISESPDMEMTNKMKKAVKQATYELEKNKELCEFLEEVIKNDQFIHLPSMDA